MGRALWLALVPLLLWFHSAGAGDFNLSGFVGPKLRIFVMDAQFPQQFDGPQASFIVNPEVRYQPEAGENRFNLVPFLRLDSHDDERTHFDLRKAYWLHLHNT